MPELNSIYMTIILICFIVSLISGLILLLIKKNKILHSVFMCWTFCYIIQSFVMDEYDAFNWQANEIGILAFPSIGSLCFYFIININKDENNI